MKTRWQMTARPSPKPSLNDPKRGPKVVTVTRGGMLGDEKVRQMDGRRKPTNNDASKWELTPQQAAAVDLLAAGRMVSETAEAVGVVRQTVSEWLNQHHGFQAELNQRR